MASFFSDLGKTFQSAAKTIQKKTAEGMEATRRNSELRSLRQPDIPFQPSMEDARRTELLRQWHRAVERCRGWAE